MTLLQDIENRRHPKKLCLFGKFVVTTTDQDRADLQTAFADLTIPASWIAEALKTRIEGKPITAIREHRRGDCPTCPQTADYLNVGAATQVRHDAP